MLVQGKIEIGDVEKTGVVVLSSEDPETKNVMVSIKGTKKGSITIFFAVGNQRSGDIYVSVKEPQNSSSSSTQSSPSSGESSTGESTGKSSTGKSQDSEATSGTSSKKSSTVLVDTNILREDFANEFDPNSKVGGFDVSEPFIKVIIPVVNRVLSILQIIGAIVLVLSIALAGFNGVIGAGDGFAEDLGLNISSSYNEYGNKVEGVQNLTQGSLSKIIRRALIGSLILESSLMIVRIVFAICTNL